MKRRKPAEFVSLIVSVAIMMSFGGYLNADETSVNDIPEETVIEESEVSSAEDDIIVPEEEEEPSEAESESVENEAAAEIETEAEAETEAETEPADEQEEFVAEGIIYFPDIEYDNDYLAEQYIMQQMSMGISASYSGYDYLSGLTDPELDAYNSIYPQICAIAAGTDEDMSTEFVMQITLTASDLGLDNLNDGNAVRDAVRSYAGNMSHNLVKTLLETCPYELYWFDKTAGSPYGYSLSVSSVVNLTYYLKLSVAERYQDGSEFKVSRVYGQSASSAAANACAIIYDNAGLDDYDKLVAYRDAICSLVDYNYDALGPGVPYGDPWQIIWVFDGDSSTKVVCEGFAKSFQYLCDCSAFQGDVYAISVTGGMTNNPGAPETEGHMWNVVSIEGNNYLVDITQYDSGWGTFLLGFSNTDYPSYLYVMDSLNRLLYTYDADAIAFFGEGALRLASSNYEPSSDTVPEFTGHSMQLSGQIGLQFFVEIPSDVNPDDCDDWYMTFSDEYGHIDSTRHYDLILSNKTSSSTPYYYAQINISSIQMAEQITPVIHFDSGVVEGDSFSAQDYIDWGLDNFNPASREYKIVCALADYGHYSQLYLSRINGWDESRYPSMSTCVTGSYDYDTVEAATSAYKIDAVTDTSVFSRITFALRFGDQVSIRVFFEPADGASISSDAFTINGVAVPAVHNADGRYVIDITGIPVTMLGNSYIIAYGDGIRVTVSPYSYVYAMLNTDTDYTDGKDLVCALYYLAQICAN